MEYFGVTNVGKRRQSNQDCFALRMVCDYLVAIVCDGMGGANGGKIASEVACETFCNSLCTRIEELHAEDPDSVPSILDKLIRKAIDAANEQIYKLALKNRDLAGMGTTLVGCVIQGHKVIFFNIGDSALYHVRGDKIRKLTRDHSLVQSLIDSGKLTPEDAAHHPNKNVITRVVGVDEHVEADLSRCNIASGYLLLCSDGLSNYLSGPDLAFFLNEEGEIQEKAELLINYANAKGGADNITAVVISL